MRDVIVGLDSALGECNSQIVGINEWVKEMKSKDEKEDKE